MIKEEQREGTCFLRLLHREFLPESRLTLASPLGGGERKVDNRRGKNWNCIEITEKHPTMGSTPQEVGRFHLVFLVWRAGDALRGRDFSPRLVRVYTSSFCKKKAGERGRERRARLGPSEKTTRSAPRPLPGRQKSADLLKWRDTYWAMNLSTYGPLSSAPTHRVITKELTQSGLSLNAPQILESWLPQWKYYLFIKWQISYCRKIAVGAWMFLSIGSSDGTNDQTFGTPYENAVNILHWDNQFPTHLIFENHRPFLLGVKSVRMVKYFEHFIKMCSNYDVKIINFPCIL